MNEETKKNQKNENENEKKHYEKHKQKILYLATDRPTDECKKISLSSSTTTTR